MRLISAACLVACAGLVGCGPAPTLTAESARTPTSRDRAGTDTPGVALARRVATKAGLEQLGGVAELRFRFVVLSGDERVADAFHRWDLRGGRDHVTWSEAGHAYDVVVALDARTATGTLDGAPLSGEAAHDAAEKAYERWVNDSYWLLLPLKLLDPGVRLTLDPPREHAGRRYEILSLRFDHVGLTPGDHYWLFVDPQTARIERWEMVLEGQTSAPRGTSFERHTAVGPLELALDHATDDGQKHIRFEDVAALDAVDPRDF